MSYLLTLWAFEYLKSEPALKSVLLNEVAELKRVYLKSEYALKTLPLKETPLLNSVYLKSV
jgi:hypothetical protein